MKNKLILIIYSVLFINNILIPINWSKNNIFIFTPLQIISNSLLQDYNSIELNSNIIIISNNDNSWLKTENIYVGSDYFPSSFFINFNKNNNDHNQFIKFILRDSHNDNILFSYDFYNLGAVTFSNIIEKNIYIQLEFYGDSFEIFSFGLGRTKIKIINENDISIEPNQVLYGEDLLKIKFYLNYPFIIDIIIFDKDGKIVTYLAKNELFYNGENILIWDSKKHKSDILGSGIYFVYFLIYIDDFRYKEIIKKFRFINK